MRSRNTDATTGAQREPRELKFAARFAGQSWALGVLSGGTPLGQLFGPVAVGDGMMIEQTDDKETRQTLLLVDDNVQHLELLQAYMEALPDVEILTATNGLEAMEAVAVRLPDLILMDIMMPKMSGFEVCKRLKSSPATRDITVVMVTALSETCDVERALECGADDYVTKPIDRVALLDLVRSLLVKG